MTKIIHQLPDIEQIKSKLLQLEPQAKPHYPAFLLDRKIGLSEATSVWLRKISKTGTIADKDLPEPNWTHPAVDVLNSALDYLGKTVEDVRLAYYLVLPPTKQIYKHRDIEPYYGTVNRYQIYFDITDEQEILQEDNLATNNSLVWFDTSVPHAYVNHSTTEPWRFIVFDVLK